MNDDDLATTPEPPYYAVIFTSVHSGEDGEGYGAMAERMVRLASGRPGYLGIESVRGDDGVGITVSYWRDLDSISGWKADAEHQVAQRFGRETWYSKYRLRISRVEREYGFEAR